jgi:hypothetical protein
MAPKGTLGLGGALHVAVEGPPAQALGALDGIADGAGGSKLATQPEGSAESTIPQALALEAVSEAVGSSRCEGGSPK